MLLFCAEANRCQAEGSDNREVRPPIQQMRNRRDVTGYSSATVPRLRLERRELPFQPLPRLSPSHSPRNDPPPLINPTQRLQRAHVHLQTPNRRFPLLSITLRLARVGLEDLLTPRRHLECLTLRLYHLPIVQQVLD